MKDEKTTSQQPGKRIKVQSVQAESKPINGEELLAQVCFYYPAYTLQSASLLSYRQVKLLLKTANRLKAAEYYNLVQISTAPHTKKGEGVKKLSEHFKKLSKD